MTQQLIGIAVAAIGIALVFVPAYQPKPQPKQWLNPGVFESTRVAHWARGEVFQWTSVSGTRFYIFRDEAGGIAAVPDFYAWRVEDGRVYEPKTNETPTPQPDEVTKP